MKSKLKRILLVMLVLGVASVVVAEIKSHINSKKENIDVVTMADDNEPDMSLYYSYAEVKNDVAYFAGSSEEAESLSRLVDALNESKPIDVSYIKSVCQIVGISSDVFSDVIGGMQDEDYITKEQFDEIYANIQATGEINNLERFNVFVLEVSKSSEEDNLNIVYDGYETYSFLVDIPDEYRDKIIDVYAKDGTIYKIIGYSDGIVALESAWIEDIKDGICTFIYNGEEKNYDITGNQEQLSDCVADITISNDGIIDIYRIENITDTRVTKVDDDYLYLDISKGSRIKTSENFMIYNISDGVSCEKHKIILTGYRNIDIVKRDNIAVAAIIRDELICDDIRVILSNDSYTSYDMDSVIFTSDASYIVTYPDGTKTTYEAGAEVTVNYADYEDGDIITAVPLEKNGITVLSLNREYGNPVYQGSIEIDIHEEALNVINIVPLETYLYSVVSCEMPSGGYQEALKAVAVCSRAYAYTKLSDGSFENYNANLDDSSLCQPYNTNELREDCIDAVKDTYGIVPAYKEQVITPLTYSTSYGVASTNDEIWGGNSYEYFFSRVDDLDRTKIDLSNEEDFIKFIDNSMGYDTVDKDMPYYRWTIDFSFEDMSKAVDSMLAKRASISSDNIRIKAEDGSYTDGETDSIGDVLSINVTERTKSGVVSAIELEGSEATILVTGSSNIRNLINPAFEQIVRQDGSVVTGWTSLPSPYYYVENTKTGFTVHGGGFGYGVGLSRNGALNLANQGYNYKYIIHHYYAYVKFISIYDNNDKEPEDEADEDF